MYPTQTWSKCLIWFAALLSPIQALQGTSIFCNVVGSCASSPQAGENEHSCCRGKTINTKCRQDVCDASNACGDHFVATVPQSPNKCPQTCWCQHPTQPQPQPSNETHFKANFDLSCYVSNFASDNFRSVSETKCLTNLSNSVGTAQQVCAHLCRFLA
jgi:hypothetical protein